MTAYNELLQQLENFIKKYYKNKILKGFLFFSMILSIVLFAFLLSENFAYFSTRIRTIFFFSFIIFAVLLFLIYLVEPVLGLIKVRRRFGYKEAAIYLGKFFGKEINDKLLNTLELRSASEGSDSKEKQLILAGIEQKSLSISHIRFKNAISFRETRPYMFAMVAFFVLFWGFYLINPGFFIDPGKRLVNYKTEFQKPAPFDLEFNVDFPARIKVNERFLLNVKTKGNKIPSELYLKYNDQLNKFNKLKNATFTYEFYGLDSDTQFSINFGKYEFGPYNILVQKPSTIDNFQVDISYPPYTDYKNETKYNTGDITIPVGSEVKWTVYTENVDSVFLFDNNDLLRSFNSIEPGKYTFSNTLFDDKNFKIIADNNNNSFSDSLSFSVKVTPDLYPEILVNEFKDSISYTGIYFTGNISDDYGFSDLNFRYQIGDSDNLSSIELNKYRIDNIAFSDQNQKQRFYYYIGLDTLSISPGENLSYFFEVYDNDEINGFKRSKTPTYLLSVPDFKEIVAQTSKNDQNINSSLRNQMNEIDQIQKEIDRLRNEMINTDNVTWEQKESLKNLLEKQQRVEKRIEELKKERELNERMNNQLTEKEQSLLEKQKELDKLFDEVVNEELTKLMQQIQEELDKLDKDEMFEKLDEMSFEMEDMEMNLDRALELFKQLQIERMLDESISMLENVMEKQENIMIDKEEIPKQENIAEQEEINEDFDSLNEMIEQLEQRNAELQRPNDFENTQNSRSDADSNLEDALNEMKNNNSSESENSQQDAMQNMNNLMNSLMSNLAQLQQQNLAEDAKKLRVLLDNLLQTSFNQENLIDDFAEVSLRDPKYFDLIQEQRKISDDLNLIKDSLVSLSKRQVQIQSFVNRELAEINMNIEKTIDNLINRRKHNARSRQQFVMMHINNLALMLNESLQNMQMSMQAQGQGQPMNNSNPQQGMGDLRQMQEKMNQMLEQLRQGHQQQQGESGQEGMSLSEQLARMAAQQEAIRKRLNEIADQYREDGTGTGNLEEIIRDMERTELDIVTNRISRQTRLRQQKILSRLLEHERAEIEREKEEKRVGETANFYEISNPEDFLKYNMDKNSAVEMLQFLPPEFKPFYKTMIEDYFLNVE